MVADFKSSIFDFWHKSLPLTISIAILLISYIPLQSDLSSNARPMVGLMCAYFWLVYRPDLFNTASVFFLGLISDIISISPIGSGLIAYLLMYVMVMNHLKYLNGKPFMVIWSGFAILLVVATFGRWLVLSIYLGIIIPPGGIIFSYLAGIALYPVIGGINASILNHCLKDD